MVQELSQQCKQKEERAIRTAFLKLQGFVSGNIRIMYVLQEFEDGEYADLDFEAARMNTNGNLMVQINECPFSNITTHFT